MITCVDLFPDDMELEEFKEVTDYMTFMTEIEKLYLEVLCFIICKEDTLKQSRTYNRKTVKKYLSFAKKRKPSKKNIRKAINGQVSYVRRNLGYITEYESGGLHISEKDSQMFQTHRKVYSSKNTYMMEICM